jgi:hypothetical protein
MGPGDVKVPDSFWSSIPVWLWQPIVVAGVLGFFLYEAARGSEKLAAILGPLGKKIHQRANRVRRAQLAIERIESALELVTDTLECATAYLATVDTPWHHEAEIIIAEKAPGLIRLLPTRQPYSDFKRKWRDEGWRPEPL